MTVPQKSFSESRTIYRLAFFLVSTNLGGAEKSLLQLLELLSLEPQYKIKVITPIQEGPLLDRLSKLPIKTSYLPMPKGFLSLSRKKPIRTLILIPWLALSLPFHLIRLRNFLNRENFHGIHSTGIKNHLLLGITSRFVKSHFTLHIRDIIKRKSLRSLLRRIDNKRVHWISNSKITQESILPIKSKVVYNGFSLDKPNFTRDPLWLDNLLGRHQSQEKVIRVGIVGAIARWKGQREFISMVQKVAPKHKNTQFYIIGSEIYDTIGEAGELELLKKQVDHGNLSERVHFVPFQKNIDSVYGALDILVHGSIEPEPFGRVIVEALGRGCVVLAADQGGPLEIIEHRVNGLLYKMGDPETMAESLVELLDSPDLLSKLKVQGAKVPKQFPLETHLQEMKAALTPTS